ncbi:MAG: CHAT domain-containing protein, partial [Cyanobacteria bacterium J06588_5]
YGFAGFAVNAGSQSALASLWPVNDEGTLGFMSQFYEHIRDSSTRVEALRQTQISLLSGEVGITDGMVYGPNNKAIAEITELEESGRWDFSHPIYWSAFTMIGNPW